MAGQNYLDIHIGGALHDRIKIFHLEPEHHPIAIGSVGAIANGTVMMLNVEAMQLQDEPAILHQLLILPATVNSPATQQVLIPAAAGFNICRTDKRLGVHGSKIT
jgi:hypothetical protein